MTIEKENLTLKENNSQHEDTFEPADELFRKELMESLNNQFDENDKENAKANEFEDPFEYGLNNSEDEYSDRTDDGVEKFMNEPVDESFSDSDEFQINTGHYDHEPRGLEEDHAKDQYDVTGDTTTIGLGEKIDQLVRESSKANDALFDSIAQTKRAMDGFIEQRASLKVLIQEKHKRSLQLRDELNHLQNTPSSPVKEDRTQEILSQSRTASTVNCNNIIEATKSISRKLEETSSSTTCRLDFAKVKESVKILEMRLEYIDLLKEITNDFVMYKRLEKEKQDSEQRFQYYRTLFS